MMYLQNNEFSGSKHIEKLEKWLNGYPGQTLLLSNQLQWTNNITTNLIKNAENLKKKISSKDHWNQYKQQHRSMIQDFIQIIRKKTSNILKKKLVSLITVEVHQNDLIQ